MAKNNPIQFPPNPFWVIEPYILVKLWYLVLFGIYSLKYDGVRLSVQNALVLNVYCDGYRTLDSLKYDGVRLRVQNVFCGRDAIWNEYLEAYE